MKLKNLRKLGRFINPETERPVNVHKGRKIGYGVDVLFYLYRGSRIFITDASFNFWEKLN